MDVFLFFLALSYLVKILTAFCLPSEVRVENKTECMKSCPWKTSMFRQICYDECPINSNEIQTELGTFCNIEHDFECQRASCTDNFPMCYRMNCLKTCPEYAVQFQNNCILKCPSTHSFMVSTDCEGPCLTGNKTCFSSCPQSHPFLFQTPRSKHCLQQCPQYTFEDAVNKTCHLNCLSKEPFLYNRTCIETCPSSSPFVLTLTTEYNSISQCSDSCLKNDVVDGEFCVNACPKGKHLLNNTCVENCPLSHPLMYPNKEGISISSIRNFGKADFMCVNSCNLETNSIVKYNLEFDKKCLNTCPQNSHFAYNGSCLSLCPLSHRYNVDYNNYYLCVASCPNDKFISNETNCRSSCPAEENFMHNKTCYKQCPLEAKYRKLNIYLSQYECFENCPENSPLIFNHTICMDKCPNKAKYKSNGTCVAQCQDELKYAIEIRTSYGFYFQTTEYSCVKNCPKEYIVSGNNCVKECPHDKNHVFNSTCLNTCPATFSFKKLEGGHYKCIAACPSETFVYNNSNCVSTCPPEARYQNNKTCVANCSDELKYKFDNFSTISVNWRDKKNIYHYFCLTECPSNRLYYLDNCVKECPKEANYLFNKTCITSCPKRSSYGFLTGNYYTCYDDCPANTYVYNQSLCVSVCPKDKNFEFNNTCFDRCPDSSDFIFHDGSYFKCMNSCTSLLMLNKTCYKNCPAEAKFQDNGYCVQECRDEKRKYKFKNVTIVSSNQKIDKYYCLHKCPVNTFDLNFTCVSHCSPDTLELDNKCVQSCPNDRSLNYTTIKGKHSCVYSCPYQTFKFERNCFDQCPSSFRHHLGTCRLECPQSHPYTDIVTQKCLSTCENNFVIVDNNVCDKKCPHDKQYIEKKTCVKSCRNPNSFLQVAKQGTFCHDKCPHHLLLMENKGTCVEKCPDNKLIVDSVCRSLYKCPNHAYLEHTDVGKRCTNRCSFTFYLDGSHCVKECPPEKVIVNAMCADECPPSHPITYKDFGSSKPRVKCYAVCPNNYVLNGTTCIEESDCHKAKHFSYEHICYDACPGGTGLSGDFTCDSLLKYILITIVLLILTMVLFAVFYYVTCFTGCKPKKLKETRVQKIKTHFQLVTRNKNKEKNTKYIINFKKGKHETAEILEVNNTNRTDTDNDLEDVVELNDGFKPISFRRRNV
ncbi:proprotein convertase subtilisin/kexin type 5-like [Saccostrea echinata]|uniref:proprotein convertase subtilisin/kexin type 5-like n=1 Tax=Saccostrea echinata TaxID=191078 RepID=UPI002A808D05|nr:proprotein convertase subtilisin/kexin type 5-like [Saccostrea echinata]